MTTRGTPVNGVNAQKDKNHCQILTQQAIAAAQTEDTKRPEYFPDINNENNEIDVSDDDKKLLIQDEDIESPDRQGDEDETTNEDKKPEKNIPPIVLKEDTN